MSIIRKRYYIWLFKAYIKRWNKTIITSVIFGVIFFFALTSILNFYVLPSIEKKIQKIGYWGVFTTDSIPTEVLSDVSYGLTKVNADGSISPSGVFKWQIKDNGKEYVFYIKKGQYFHNNKELDANSLNLPFKDLQKKVINKYTVSFSLKEPYSPFMVLAAEPIIGRNFAGLGEFKVKKMELNGGFVKTIILEDKNDASIKKIINFYPTQRALKIAYALGEVDTAYGLADLAIKDSDISKWNNSHISKTVDYNQLVLIFYNNSDPTLSNKKIRQALGYAIPSTIDEGERAFSPISPKSIYFVKTPNYGISDIGIAKSVIDSEKDLKGKTFEISVNEDLKHEAEEVSDFWSKIGVKTKIKTVADVPSNFQILIYPIKLPLDPDQYNIWHSGQVNNIVKYKNMRIDKILEDGRSTLDTEKRISLYSDFQKYIIDDVPATFFYFPYTYSVTRN